MEVPSGHPLIFASFSLNSQITSFQMAAFDNANFQVKSSGGVNKFSRYVKNVNFEVYNGNVSSISVLKHVYFGKLSNLSPTEGKSEVWLRTGNVCDYMVDVPSQSVSFRNFLFLNVEGTENSLLEKVKASLATQEAVLINSISGINSNFVAYYIVSFQFDDAAALHAQIDFKYDDDRLEHPQTSLSSFIQLARKKLAVIRYIVGVEVETSYASATEYLENLDLRNDTIKMKLAIEDIVDILSGLHLSEEELEATLVQIKAKLDE